MWWLETLLACLGFGVGALTDVARHHQDRTHLSIGAIQRRGMRLDTAMTTFTADDFHFQNGGLAGQDLAHDGL